jgi:hypothetical protein
LEEEPVRALLTLILGALTLAFAVQPGLAQDRYGKQKVVYHLNYSGGENDGAYLAALGNMRNHLTAVGVKNMDAKFVLHGDGVNILKAAKTNDRVKGAIVALKADNVEFLVCKNTLTARKIDAEKDLFEVFEQDIVPSGVAELSYLQQKGYTYVKP